MNPHTETPPDPIPELPRIYGPLEVSAIPEGLEISLETHTPVANTMSDALLVTAESCRDQLTRGEPDATTAFALEATIIRIGALSAKLRGRQPFILDPKTAAFRASIASGAAAPAAEEAKRRPGITGVIGRVLGSLTLKTTRRSAASIPSTEQVDEPSRPEPRKRIPVTLHGDEAILVTEAMKLAPNVLEARAAALRERGPKEHAHAVINPEEDNALEIGKKLAALPGMQAEMKRAWEQNIADLEDRARDIRHINRYL